jgi:hypothetical protein
MIALRTGIVVVALGLGLAGLLAGDAATVGVGRQPSEAATPATKPANWTEIKWPFPLDQWGVGRAFECRDCAAQPKLYLRAKLGFCNCTSGVADDAELDRVGDLELLSDKFKGLSDGRPIKVGWMNGRSRPYQVAIPYASPRSVLAIAFNDKCDVVVATVVADQVGAAEQAALNFLNGDLVLRWAERELGL